MSQVTIRVTEDSSMKQVFQVLQESGKFLGLKKPQIMRMALFRLYQEEAPKMEAKRQDENTFKEDTGKIRLQQVKKEMASLRNALKKQWGDTNKDLSFTQDEIDALSY